MTRLLLSLSLPLALSVACGDNIDNTDDARIRVVHASPDAPAVDVYVKGDTTPVATNLAYTETTNYLTVPAGDYTFELRAAGAPATDAPAYETPAVTLAEGSDYAAMALGLLGSTDSADSFRVLAIEETFTAPANNGAMVRIIHGGADAPTVEVDVGNDANAEISNFERFADTGPSSVELPAGQELQIAFWDSSNLARLTVFTTPQLAAAGNYTLIATGLIADEPRDDTGFGVLAIGDNGTIGLIKQNPVVRAFHASPDAPAVDICAGSTELVSNLAYGELSDGIQLPPGSYDLDFYTVDAGACSGTLANATPIATGTLAAGQEYVAAAAGELTPEGQEQAFGLLALADLTVDTGSDASVIAAHASGDAPSPVDIGTLDTGNIVDPAQFPGVAYGSQSAAVSLPPNTYVLGVGTAGAAPAATFDVTTAADQRLLVIAAGAFSQDGDDNESFALWVIDAANWQVAGSIAPN